MNEQIVIAAVAAAGVSLLLALVATAVAIGARRRIANAVALAEGIKEGFVAKSTELAELQRRHEELTLRVARLGSPRARAAASSSEPADELVGDGAEKKMTITERRHRVIQLSRRGQDAATIASMLGIPRGEVDLIINLHVAA